MKFNFKKIASVLTSTVMLSSTVAFAAAANFPEPFVKNGAGSYAIVVGAGANTAAGDLTAAQNIDSYLKDMVTDTDDTETSVTVDGDSFLLEKSSDKLNIGEDVSDVEDTLTDSELETLLADGEYENDDNDAFEYTQEILLSDDLAVNLVQDDDDNTYIGMDLSDGDLVLNYTLEFRTDAEGGATSGSDEFPELSDTYITILGKEYYISDVENSADGVTMTLLDSADKVTLSKGESVSVDVGGESYTLELTYSNSNSGVKVKVNDVETDLLDEDETEELSNGAYITILENLAGEDADLDQAVVSIGSGEIVLTDGEEVEFNGEEISEIDEYDDAVVTAFITNSSTDLQSIEFSWELGDDVDFKSGDEIVLPGFESFKLIMGSFVPFAEEETMIDFSGEDTANLNVELIGSDDGESYKLPILYTSDDTNITTIGKDANTLLWTNNSANLAFTEANSIGDDYFVITRYNADESESYVLKVDSIGDTDEDNSTVFKDLITGDKYTVEVDGDTVEIGDITLTLSSASEDSKQVRMSISGDGTETFGSVVTKQGLLISLPLPGFVNASTTTWTGTFTEETGDEDGEGTIAGGASFTATFDVSSDGIEVTGTNLTEVPEEDGSDVEIAYLASELGTKVSLDSTGDQTDLTVTYHGGESYVELWAAEGAATSSGGGSSSGSLVVTDDDVSSVKTKNLIVVGGTCVNKVAAKVLGVEDQYPLCGDAWETLTTVGAGKFLIQSVTSPYSDTKVAMLVAGYNQVDTANAAAALETEDVDTSETRPYIASAGSTLSLG